MKLQAFLPLATYPDENSDAIAANASAIAANLGADLHALALTATIPRVSSVLSPVLMNVPEMIQQAEALSKERSARLLREVAKEAATRGVNATTKEAASPLTSVGEIAAVHARYFDLSLVGWEAGRSTSRMVAEGLIFGSGRPVVLLPELSQVGSVSHVGIAWDGSRVAARAVADARPFLLGASRISIFTVIDEKPLAGQDVGQRLVESLKEHGLSAEAVPLRVEDCPIAETLQQRAIQQGCHLLVMGGYGHSRVRDFVLGGATEGILSDLLMPILLSH